MTTTTLVSVKTLLQLGNQIGFLRTIHAILHLFDRGKPRPSFNTDPGKPGPLLVPIESENASNRHLSVGNWNGGAAAATHDETPGRRLDNSCPRLGCGLRSAFLRR